MQASIQHLGDYKAEVHQAAAAESNPDMEMAAAPSLTPPSFGHRRVGRGRERRGKKKVDRREFVPLSLFRCGRRRDPPPPPPPARDKRNYSQHRVPRRRCRFRHLIHLERIDRFNSPCALWAAATAGLVNKRGSGSRDGAIVSGDGFREELVPEVPAAGQIEEPRGAC